MAEWIALHPLFALIGAFVIGQITTLGLLAFMRGAADHADPEDSWTADSAMAPSTAIRGHAARESVFGGDTSRSVEFRLRR